MNTLLQTFKTFYLHGNQEKEFVNAVRNLMVQDKEFATRMVFQNGIRGDVTSQLLREKIPELNSLFNSRGRLTLGGRIEVGEQIWRTNLHRGARWEQILTEPVRNFKPGEIKIRKVE